MPLSTTQQQTLKRIGIDVWQPRIILPGAKQTLSTVCFELFDTEKKHLGWLLLENEITPGENWLLAKMLTAFGFSADDLGWGDVLAIVALDENDLIWVMGDFLAQCIIKIKPALAITHTPTLADCLVDRSAKKSVWDQINSAKSKLRVS